MSNVLCGKKNIFPDMLSSSDGFLPLFIGTAVD